MEIKKDRDVSVLENKIAELDEILKNKYDENVERIVTECPLTEKPYFPESFWWRHPSKILEGKKKALQQGRSVRFECRYIPIWFYREMPL